MDHSRVVGTGGGWSYWRRLLDILPHSPEQRLSRDIGDQHLFQLNDPVFQ